MALSVWWKGLETAFRLVGRLLGVLRKIPFVDDAVDHLQRTVLNPVVIKLVRDADDPDLDAALSFICQKNPRRSAI